MIKGINLPAGAQMMIGKAANPFPRSISDVLTSVVLSVPDIEEAHLPLIFVPGVMKEPVQVLAILLRKGADLRALGERLLRELPSALPKEMDLDIWPIPDSGALADVRAAGSCIAAKS